MVNGRSRPAETRDFLRKTSLKKGDEVEVLLSASDGVQSTEKILKTTIVNAPPEWKSDPREMKDINGFIVEAVDPDGDRVTYRLEGAPKGMSISPSGKLSYVGSKDEAGGTYTISVIAEDPDKLQVKWVFSISLSAGSAAGK